MPRMPLWTGNRRPCMAGLGQFDHDYTTELVLTSASSIRVETVELSYGQTQVINFNIVWKSTDTLRWLPMNPDTTTCVRHSACDRWTGSQSVMVNHGCHPTGLGDEIAISADYPGEMRKVLVDSGRVDVAMFLQGAAGDIKQGARLGEKVGWIAQFHGAQVMGREMARAVLESLDGLAPVEGPLRAISQRVKGPLKDWPCPQDVIFFEMPMSRCDAYELGGRRRDVHPGPWIPWVQRVLRRSWRSYSSMPGDVSLLGELPSMVGMMWSLLSGIRTV